MRRLLAALVLVAAGPAQAYCPSYTASSPNNTLRCAIEARPGTNPTVEEWNVIFARIAGGPASWGDGLPTVNGIRSGCDPYETVPARYPCELLKAIGMAESSWKQFCVPDRPADQVGGASRTIISFDCGYGVSQVTSGMHVGETPPFDREKVAGDAVYNLATGAKILADKWRAVACVGGRDPSTIEHWYTATWAYNGLSYTNNPNNPNFRSDRGVWNPNVGGAAPYQEKVFGWMEHTTRWPATQLAYPDRGDIGDGRSPGVLPEPRCASPTDCTRTRPTHVSTCGATQPPPPDAGVPDAAAESPGSPDAAAPPGVAIDVAGGCGSGGGMALVVVLVAGVRRRGAPHARP
jgi:hypothetical protein